MYCQISNQWLPTSLDCVWLGPLVMFQMSMGCYQLHKRESPL